VRSCCCCLTRLADSAWAPLPAALGAAATFEQPNANSLCVYGTAESAPLHRSLTTVIPCVCAMCHARATPMSCTSHIRTAPFQRVWIALLELETPFTHEIIDLADKPSEFLRLSELASGGKGKSTVPLLEMGEDVVSESLDIVRLLGKAAMSKGPGSQQPTLHPPAPAARSTYK